MFKKLYGLLLKSWLSLLVCYCKVHSIEIEGLGKNFILKIDLLLVHKVRFILQSVGFVVLSFRLIAFELFSKFSRNSFILNRVLIKIVISFSKVVPTERYNLFLKLYFLNKMFDLKIFLVWFIKYEGIVIENFFDFCFKLSLYMFDLLHEHFTCNFFCFKLCLLNHVFGSISKLIDMLYILFLLIL